MSLVCALKVSRQTAFNLLCQLCSGSLKNFEELADLLAEHHLSGTCHFLFW